MTATARPATTSPGTTNATTSRMRRWGGAAAMVVGPWGFVATNTAYALAIRDGGNEDTAADTLALYAAHPDLVRIALLAGMLASLLMVPAVLAALRLVPRSGLALAGGSLMIAGYVCYLAVLHSGFSILTMAERGPTPDYAEVVEATQAQPLTLWVFLVFVAGNLLGTALFAIGLWRGGAPRWGALAILAWPPLHVFGLVFLPNEVPQVIGAVLQACGFAILAVAVVRRT